MAEYKASKIAPWWVFINPFAWILWILDFVIWLVYFLLVGWVFAIMRCMKPNSGTSNDIGEASNFVRKTPETNIPDLRLDDNGLILGPTKECYTAWDCLSAAFTKFAANKCMGTRTYLGESFSEEQAKEKKKQDALKAEGKKSKPVFPKKIFGETTWKTYKQCGETAKHFGRGLVSEAIGMTPSTALSKADFEATDAPDTLLLWEDTCAEWMLGLCGAFSQSLVVATSYATLGIGGVIESMTQCDCTTIMCNRSKVKDIIKNKDKMPKLKTIIYTDFYYASDKDGKPNVNMGEKKMPEPFLEATKLPDEQEGLKVLHFDDVVAIGAGMKEVKDTPPKADNMAVVMYTSGSTGKPKGVVIAHKNICASIGGMKNEFAGFGTEGEECYLAYLPAAHILELVAEMAMISYGATIGYADPRTLSSTGAGRADKDMGIHFAPSLELAPGAIQEFKPTVMAAVPKIWQILKAGIEGKIGEGSPVVRFLFDTAFAACANAAGWRFCPLLGLIFKAVQKMVGGRMKSGISGGGPISDEVQTFIRTVFGMPLIQGYALTETCCAGTVQNHDDVRNGVVGSPVGSVEIKLRNSTKKVPQKDKDGNDLESAELVEENEAQDKDGKGYLVTDTVHVDGSPCIGRGEVLISGPSVSLGYYAKYDQKESLLKKTKEEFIENEFNDNKTWFHTGDIGMFTPDGNLKLVGRLKSLIKLKGGEYVAIEHMETVYSNCPYVHQINGGICIFADGNLDQSVAIVQADADKIKELGEELGVEGDIEKLCLDDKIVKAVLAKLNAVGQAAKLGRNEKLGAIYLVSGTGGKDFPGTITSPFTPENGMLTASNKIDRNSILHGKKKDGGDDGNPFNGIIQNMRKKCGADDYGSMQS